MSLETRTFPLDTVRINSCKTQEKLKGVMSIRDPVNGTWLIIPLISLHVNGVFGGCVLLDYCWAMRLSLFLWV